MLENDIGLIDAALKRLQVAQPAAYVRKVLGQTIVTQGAGHRLRIGDRAEVRTGARTLPGEVIHLRNNDVAVLLDEQPSGVAIGDLVTFGPPPVFAPHRGWIGRVVDPDGRALDGRPILAGRKPRPLDCAPPAAHLRRGFGARMETGMAVFNTMLPIVQGQRIGLFAGAGVGKSTLIADLAKGLSADVVVIGLVGERGREVRHFVQDVLGPDAMKKAVVVAATSDRAAPVRRRCALAAMAVAEHFRDEGLVVSLLIDSVTRFAEAHREVALAQGEDANLRGYPASTAAALARLCERAGPGTEGTGDISAVFSVLVAGSDMDEPIADMLRGILDGHVILDRKIAEKGRFPAIDILRSVSRSLPEAATTQENAIIADARQLLAAYDRSAVMIQAGLYEAGSDPLVDRAVSCFDALEDFTALNDGRDRMAHFAKLRQATTPSSTSDGAR